MTSFGLARARNRNERLQKFWRDLDSYRLVAPPDRQAEFNRLARIDRSPPGSSELRQLLRELHDQGPEQSSSDDQQSRLRLQNSARDLLVEPDGANSWDWAIPLSLAGVLLAATAAGATSSVINTISLDSCGTVGSESDTGESVVSRELRDCPDSVSTDPRSLALTVADDQQLRLEAEALHGSLDAEIEAGVSGSIDAILQGEAIVRLEPGTGSFPELERPVVSVVNDLFVAADAGEINIDNDQLQILATLSGADCGSYYATLFELHDRQISLPETLNTSTYWKSMSLLCGDASWILKDLRMG